ncbi:unnamed protein product [Protopolystoma xenopodis]|uniref:Uncharacterized protein n=1 Tax=Protopolystoma xenopodis TaxID=117903 RepID=A0A448XD52_9PLAT|nr:unnamed protein product [Protopolystoma xenopodis]
MLLFTACHPSLLKHHSLVHFCVQTALFSPLPLTSTRFSRFPHLCPTLSSARLPAIARGAPHWLICEHSVLAIPSLRRPNLLQVVQACLYMRIDDDIDGVFGDNQKDDCELEKRTHFMQC